MFSAALLCIVFRIVNSCKLHSLSAAISNGHRWGVTSRFPPVLFPPRCCCQATLAIAILGKSLL